MREDNDRLILDYIEEEFAEWDDINFIDSYLTYSKFKKLRYGPNFKAVNQFIKLIPIKVKIIPNHIRINKENINTDMDYEKDSDEPDN